MAERFPDYTNLSTEQRHEVLHELEDEIIEVVAHHPDAREDLVIEVVHHKHPYGHMAWLAIQVAVKEGHLLEVDCGACTILRMPDKSVA